MPANLNRAKIGMSTNRADRKARDRCPNEPLQGRHAGRNKRAITTKQRENRDWQGFTETVNFRKVDAQIAFGGLHLRILFASSRFRNCRFCAWAFWLSSAS